MQHLVVVQKLDVARLQDEIQPQGVRLRSRTQHQLTSPPDTHTRWTPDSMSQLPLLQLHSIRQSLLARGHLGDGVEISHRLALLVCETRHLGVALRELCTINTALT